MLIKLNKNILVHEKYFPNYQDFLNLGIYFDVGEKYRVVPNLRNMSIGY